MYAVRITPKAIDDVRGVYAWYQKETQNIADQLLEELQSYVDKIANNPQHFTTVPNREARFAILKRFPYKIYFQINEVKKRVEIVAVVHKSLRPQIWKRRL